MCIIGHLFSSGAAVLQDGVEDSREELTLVVMVFQRIRPIKNLFYCGLLVHKSLEGANQEGTHEKLVSREVFLHLNEVQAANPHGYKMTVEDERTSLKRFIRGEKCGKHMTGYIAYKNQKFYYKCRTKACRVNQRADDLHPKFTKLLEDYTIPTRKGVHTLSRNTQSLLLKTERTKRSRRRADAKTNGKVGQET